VTKAMSRTSRRWSFWREQVVGANPVKPAFENHLRVAGW